MLNIAPAWYSSVEWQYPPHERQGAYEEEGRAINTLKVGCRQKTRAACALHWNCASAYLQQGIIIPWCQQN